MGGWRAAVKGTGECRAVVLLLEKLGEVWAALGKGKMDGEQASAEQR